ncbi:MAG: DUF3710 domain-containing protein [Actinomycetia bacterium]|nr:DUF3710 domain-containing protein [Actinomycetes bacterium]
MLGFGRKKKDQAEQEPAVDEHKDTAQKESVRQDPAPTQPGSSSQAGDGAAQEVSAEDREQSTQRSESGPFDLAEVDAADLEGFIDLGGLRIRREPGVNVRLDVDQKSQRVVAVTLEEGQASVQVQAFAAPKSRGLWPQVRTELAESVRSQQGMVDITDGPFGRQVLAKIPASLPDGQRGLRVARFVGVDGPRWFLRGVFTGDAAVQEQAAARMEELFRGIIVVRGREPMAPRDLLPLEVPAEAVRRTEPEEEPNLQVPQRGPEVTRIG